MTTKQHKFKVGDVVRANGSSPKRIIEADMESESYFLENGKRWWEPAEFELVTPAPEPASEPAKWMELTKKEEQQILRQRQEAEARRQAAAVAHLWYSCPYCNGRGDTGYFGPYRDKSDERPCTSCDGRGRWRITQAEYDAHRQQEQRRYEQRAAELRAEAARLEKLVRR